MAHAQQWRAPQSAGQVEFEFEKGMSIFIICLRKKRFFLIEVCDVETETWPDLIGWQGYRKRSCSWSWAVLGDSFWPVATSALLGAAVVHGAPRQSRSRDRCVTWGPCGAAWVFTNSLQALASGQHIIPEVAGTCLRVWTSRQVRVAAFSGQAAWARAGP